MNINHIKGQDNLIVDCLSKPWTYWMRTWKKVYQLSFLQQGWCYIMYILQHFIFNKYKTFSVLIYSYTNTSGNWENEKLCGNSTPEGQSVFTQFRVFPISKSVDITIYQYGKKFYLFYNIAQRNIKK
jgi:hypothetical protein